MVISPAVQTPKPGDPITAKWAADLAAAVNSCANPAEREGEISTPYGKASLAPGMPMLGTAKMPMPFDCAIFRPDGESADSIFIWLPDGGAEYVTYNCKPIGPAQGQDVGDSDTAWVEIGTVTNDEAHYVYLKFHADSDGNVDGWEIEDTDTPWSPQDGEGEGEGDCAPPPQILLAAYNISADSTVPSAGDDNKFPSGQSGLVQYHHGTIEVTCACGPDCPDVYSVTQETGTLPECVAARYVFKRQHREIDPETGECVDSTGTGSSEETNIDVPAPPEYAISSSDESGCRVTISLTKTPCGGNATNAGSVTLDKARTYAITEDPNPSSCEEKKYSLDETCDGSTSSVGAIVVPKPPEYSLDSSSVSGGTQVDLKVKPCGGTASVVSSVTIPSATGISGTFLTGLTSLAVTTSGLVLTATTATYVNGSLTATGTTTVTCPVTSC